MLPKLKLEYTRSSFCYMGAKLYNDLPHDIRNVGDITKFNCALQQYFIGRCLPLVCSDYLIFGAFADLTTILVCLSFRTFISKFDQPSTNLCRDSGQEKFNLFIIIIYFIF